MSLPVSQTIGQGFQRAYGNGFKNTGWQVIPHGSNYYVLGSDQPSAGALDRGTISYINESGSELWTRRLNMSSSLMDAVVTPGGDLLVVGNTLPAGESSASIIGSIGPTGNINWFNSYDQPGPDYFWRIEKSLNPDNSDFPYVVAGTQADDPENAVDDNAVLLTLNESGALGWKKISNMPGDNELTHDLEILPNGDIILGGFWGFGGSIVWLNNACEQVTAVSVGGPFFQFTDITPASSGGFYAVGGTGSEFYLSKLTEDFINYDFQIEGLTSITQVWEDGTNGTVDVVGTVNTGGGDRAVVINLTDEGEEFFQNWVKYLDNGQSATTGSSIWFLPPNWLAYVEGRVTPGGFGGFDMFLSVSDLALTTCMTVEVAMDITSEAWLWEGPEIQQFTFWDVPQPTPISTTLITWQEIDLCFADSCYADFIFEYQNDCGQVIFTNLSTSTSTLNYCWDFDNNPNTCESTAANPIWQFPLPACQDWNVCLTVSDDNGCSATKCQQVSIYDTGIPIMTCPPDIVLECTDSTLPAHTGTALATDNCTFNPMVSYTDILTSFNCTVTISRTWKATDDCNNFVTCTQRITITDLTPPQITCSPGQVVNVPGASNPCQGFVNVTPPSFSDNCNISSPPVNNINGTTDASGTYPSGNTIVTWTATDDCGNTATCVSTITVTCNASECCLAWAKQLGGPMFSESSSSLSQDAHGNIYVSGEFRGTADFDPGPAIFSLTSVGNVDVYIAKLDPAGNFIWAARMGGSGNEYLASCAIDPFGNVYAVGTFESTADFDPGTGAFNLTSNGDQDVYTVKLDPLGNFLWATAVGGAWTDYGNAVTIDATGDIYILGNFITTVDFDPGSGVFNMSALGSNDIFLLKLSPAGLFVWAKQMGNLLSDVGIDIVVDLNNNIYLTGTFGGTVDFDPGPGVFNLSASVPSDDMFVSKLDPSGNFIWATSFAGNSQDEVNAITTDLQGNVFFTGYFSGPTDFDPGVGTNILTSGGYWNIFICKLLSTGVLDWVKQMGSSNSDIGFDISTDNAGNVYTTGYFNGTVDFDPGISTFVLTAYNSGTSGFIHKLDNTGNFIWAKQIEGVSTEIVNNILVEANGSIFTSGVFQGAADFDPGSNSNILTSSASAADVFVSKLTMCPLTDTCFCKSPGFTNMILHWDNGPGTSIQCETSYEGIPCPEPGSGYFLTGKFECEGDECELNPYVSWDLQDPSGNFYYGSSIASPYFLINLPPAYTSIPGIYTMTLTSFCGTDTCSCEFQFIVECPNQCPCDINDLQADVNQGFNYVVLPASCQACFTPKALTDCDSVKWYVTNPNGTPIGSSLGNNTFCYTFSSSGTYTVFMEVTRRKPDGSLCESFRKSQTVKIYCGGLPQCDVHSFDNPTFSEGAEAGNLGDGGASNGWTSILGRPMVVEGSPGSLDGWTMSLWGNLDTASVLTSINAMCLKKDTGTFTLRTKGCHPFCPYVKIRMHIHTDDHFNLNECDSTNCFDIASFYTPPIDADEWVDLQIPYDIRNWNQNDTCSEGQGILVKPIIYVTNALSNEQGGESTYTQLQLDNVCINGLIIAVTEPSKEDIFHIFPNPTSGDISIEFPSPASSNMKIRVVGIEGQVLMEKGVDVGISLQTIETEVLPQGMYFLQILSKGQMIAVNKVVKQ